MIGERTGRELTSKAVVDRASNESLNAGHGRHNSSHLTRKEFSDPVLAHPGFSVSHQSADESFKALSVTYPVCVNLREAFRGCTVAIAELQHGERATGLYSLCRAHGFFRRALVSELGTSTHRWEQGSTPAHLKEVLFQLDTCLGAALRFAFDGDRESARQVAELLDCVAQAANEAAKSSTAIASPNYS